MVLTIRCMDDDGRWIGSVPELPGTFSYGATKETAMARVAALALRILADRVENGELALGTSVSFVVEP